MPCNCDHMEPSQHEAESKNVAIMICYLISKLGFDVHPYIVEAAKSPYGNKERVHDLTKYLCQTIGLMTDAQRDQLIYDGRSPSARRIADWWDAHQEADKARAIKEEVRLKGYDVLRASALAKLTPAEREVLGV